MSTVKLGVYLKSANLFYNYVSEPIALRGSQEIQHLWAFYEFGLESIGELNNILNTSQHGFQDVSKKAWLTQGHLAAT